MERPYPDRMAERPERKLSIILTRYSGQLQSSRLLIMAGLQTVSKALLMSRNAHVVTSFFLWLDSTKLVSDRAADSVDFPLLKPCCASLNHDPSAARVVSLFNNIFSKSLAKAMRMLLLQSVAIYQVMWHVKSRFRVASVLYNKGRG